MIISASIECEWCGQKIVISKKKSTRSFMIEFNKQKRIHDWRCAPRGKMDKNIKIAEEVTLAALTKMMADH